MLHCKKEIQKGHNMLQSFHALTTVTKNTYNNSDMLRMLQQARLLVKLRDRTIYACVSLFVACSCKFNFKISLTMFGVCITTTMSIIFPNSEFFQWGVPLSWLKIKDGQVFAISYGMIWETLEIGLFQYSGDCGPV